MKERKKLRNKKKRYSGERWRRLECERRSEKITGQKDIYTGFKGVYFHTIDRQIDR